MKSKPVSQIVYIIGEAGAYLVASTLMIVLISRFRSEEFLGGFTLIVSWLTIFQVLACSGVAETILREMGKYLQRSGAYVNCGFVFGLGFSVLAMLILSGCTFVLRYPEQLQTAILLGSLTIIPAAFLAVCRSGFVAHQKMPFAFWITVIEIMGVYSVNAYYVLAGSGLFPIVATMIVGKTMAAGLAVWCLHRHAARVRWSLDYSLCRELLSPILSFSLIRILGLAFSWRIDIIMLSKMSTLAVTGTYAIVSKFIDLLSVLPSAFAQVALPRVAKDLLKPSSFNREQFANSIRWLFVVIVPIGVGMMLFAKELIVTIFGARFEHSALILRILLVAFFFLTADIILRMLCQAINRQKVDIYILLIQAGANITLNLLLIPRLADVGAAIATLISLCISFVLHQYFVARTVMELHWMRYLARPLVIAITVAAGASLCAGIMHFVLRGSIFVLGYCLAMYITHRMTSPQRKLD